MAKKRGKSKAKVTSKKIPSRKTSAKKHLVKSKPAKEGISIIAEKPKTVKDALHDLDILAEEKKVERKINDVEKKEEAIEKKEAAIIKEEKKVEKETEKIEAVEKEIKKEVTTRPLSKLTIRDINKGIIGAFVGVVAHFAFIYGRQIAKDITTTKAAVLIVFSYLLIVVLMYETGYRVVKEKKILGILPKRATAIYITSLIVIPIIFYLFNQLNLSDPVDLFKQIAVSSVFASMGAGTADIIGKE